VKMSVNILMMLKVISENFKDLLLLTKKLREHLNPLQVSHFISRCTVLLFNVISHCKYISSHNSSRS